MSEVNHGADGFAAMHQVEGFVDLLERHRVRDEGIELDLAAHRLLHHARQLRATFDATECGAAPHATGDELERTRADLLPRARDADDDALAPPLVAALERR